MNRLLIGIIVVVSSLPASADILLPVSVTGSGQAEYLSALPNDFPDFGGTGVISFMGTNLAYTLTSADVGGLMVTGLNGTGLADSTLIVADFSNQDPVVFASTDPGENSEIAFNYSGTVTITRFNVSSPFNAVFIADFVPIAGSGSGIFADVTGGSFEMTAATLAPFIPRVDPSQQVGDGSFTVQVPYTWISSGGSSDALRVVPEPTSIGLLTVATLFALRSRRRKA
jgi:hypothetical protein